MNLTDSIRRSLLLACLGLSALGPACSRPEPPGPVAGPIAVAGAYAFGDRQGSASRVSRQIAPDGRETLHGETDLAGAAAERVVEDVTLDAHGRLERAVIALSGGCGERASKTVTIDRLAGTVTVTTAAGSATWSPAGDSPWIYAPIEGPRGLAASTPIAAWVALRAASGSPSVRRIDADARRAFAVASDQIAIPTERGTTVALGDDGIDASDEFVDEVRLGSGVTLGRIEGAPAEVACAAAAGLRGGAL
jgi:hypothetical protein